MTKKSGRTLTGLVIRRYRLNLSLGQDRSGQIYRPDLIGLRSILKRYLMELVRHPSLLVYAFRHPSLRELRGRAKELDRLDRDGELQSIRLQSINKRERTFVFNGREYEYFYHDYNETWCSERTVEVPIIWRIVQDNPNARTLEVGNVLSHYFKTTHTIVDKYEKWPGVINEDIVEFNPPTKFDLIVSISTLEHVGWNIRHEARDPPKFFRAISKLTSLLMPGGMIWFTVPLGYNPYVDSAISSKALKLDGEFFLKRISSDNSWKQCDFDEVRNSVYGVFKIRSADTPPFPRANAILVGLISAENSSARN